MKINKNSTLYKVGVALFIILAIVYYVYTWMNEEVQTNDNSQTTEYAGDIDTGNNETDVSDLEDEVEYRFRNQNLLDQHYEKHGIDMGFDSAESYEKAASKVVNNKETLHKVEKEDGDDVYYLEKTNEFVVISQDGYIRTYFNPDDGLDYFNRQ